jgi:hypothetical protein
MCRISTLCTLNKVGVVVWSEWIRAVRGVSCGVRGAWCVGRHDAACYPAITVPPSTSQLPRSEWRADGGQLSRQPYGETGTITAGAGSAVASAPVQPQSNVPLPGPTSGPTLLCGLQCRIAVVSSCYSGSAYQEWSTCNLLTSFMSYFVVVVAALFNTI